MSKLTMKHEDKKRQRTVRMLKKLIELIESQKFAVNTAGFWECGLAGRWQFRVDVTDVKVLSGREAEN